MTWMVLKHPRPTKALAFVEWARDCPLIRRLRLETIASDGASAGGQKRSLRSPRRGHQAGGDAGARQEGARPRYPVWSESSSGRRTSRPPLRKRPPELDQARIDKWIRDRVVDWRDSCWRCRKPIVVGQKWTFVWKRRGQGALP